jgi:hypothetical protein
VRENAERTLGPSSEDDDEYEDEPTITDPVDAPRLSRKGGRIGCSLYP